MVKGTSDQILVAIQIMIQPWWRFALSECLEYDDYLWIFDCDGVSLDGYLNDWW